MYRKQENKDNKKKGAQTKKKKNNYNFIVLGESHKMDQRYSQLQSLCLCWWSLCPQQKGSFDPRILTRKSHGTFFWRLYETPKWTKMSEEWHIGKQA